jgi:hypothetical protein
MSATNSSVFTATSRAAHRTRATEHRRRRAGSLRAQAPISRSPPLTCCASLASTACNPADTAAARRGLARTVASGIDVNPLRNRRRSDMTLLLGNRWNYRGNSRFDPPRILPAEIPETQTSVRGVSLVEETTWFWVARKWVSEPANRPTSARAVRVATSCESFNGKLRDELLNGEIFYTLREAQVLIAQWRVHYNTIRPHSSLSYRPPAPETLVPIEELPNQIKAA